jgi:hypothetical protein
MPLRGMGKKCSMGSIAITPATETAALIAIFSCVHIYKRICVGRHSTEMTNVNNPASGHEKVSGSAAKAHNLSYAQWPSSNLHCHGAISSLDLFRLGGYSNPGRATLLIFSCKRPTSLGMFPKFLVRMRELMVALTLKIRAM